VNQDERNGGLLETPVNPKAKALLRELDGLLQNIYAEMDVSRERVREKVREGRALAEDPEVWKERPVDAEEFSQLLDVMERRIHQTLDLKRLKEEGLVKTVKF
jgi:hypothetical protein